MNTIKNIFSRTGVILFLTHCWAVQALRKPKITCTYEEKQVYDVAQGHKIKKVQPQELYETTCCPTEKENTGCQEALKKRAEELCDSPGTIPEGYRLTSVDIQCGDDDKEYQPESIDAPQHTKKFVIQKRSQQP